MGVAVYNVSATSARVSWPPSPGCLDTFYSVMYDPNWNSLMKGYKRKSFLHEERIPVSQTSAHLANLLPQTAYFLCVTCQAANPVQDQCQMFSTPGDSGEAHDRAGWELAVGVWLTCCALLLVIAGILLWGCLRVSWPPGGGFGRPYATRRPSEDGAALQPPPPPLGADGRPRGCPGARDEGAKPPGNQPARFHGIEVIEALLRPLSAF
ncbi:LOW QUALITY PROTEIN: fibronectin type III domain-containing protein 9 [Gasterosteus aculeatus]